MYGHVYREAYGHVYRGVYGHEYRDVYGHVYRDVYDVCTEMYMDMGYRGICGRHLPCPSRSRPTASMPVW